MKYNLHRSAAPEFMDDLHCSGPVVERTLHELDIINRTLGGNRITIDGVFRLIGDAGPDDPALHIADLGCGSGDMLRRIAIRARKLGIPMRLTGIDANPFIIDYARQKCADYPEIEFRVADVRSDDFGRERFDIITCTLFLHHFPLDELAHLLDRFARQVRMGIVINDLHRHWLAFHSIGILTALFSRSAMVCHDAPLSVLRSFTRSDWTALFHRAGITGFELHWRWAFRWQAIVYAPAAN